MQNFSAIRLAVRPPFEKKLGGGAPLPPALARVKVTNDIVERGIKLIQVFADLVRAPATKPFAASRPALVSLPIF